MTRSANSVVVEWGDFTGGGGYGYHHRTSFDAPPKPFVEAAQDLMKYPAVQPPTDWNTSSGSPVLGLAYTPVTGQEARWCFIVQGRGKAFPGVGGCQFVFFDHDVDAADCWAYGSSAVTANGLITPKSLRTTGSRRTADPAIVESILDAVLAERAVVGIDGDATAVAAAIGRALSLLPEPVVQQYLWFTHVLGVRRDASIVSGRWPAELATSPIGRRVNDWLASESRNDSKTDPRQADVVDWLIAQAGSGDVDRHRHARSAKEFVAAIAHDELPIRERDLPRLLAERSPDLGTRRAVAALRSWAAKHPAEAIRHALDRQLPAAVSSAIMDALLRVHQDAGPGSNPISFPPAPDRTGEWHHFLALYLRRVHPDKTAILEFANKQLFAKGKPLDTEERRTRERGWLESLGLTVTDFGTPIDLIVDEIRDKGEVGYELLPYIDNAPDPLAVVGAVIEKFGKKVGRITIADATAILSLAPSLEFEVTQSILRSNAGLGYPLTAQWAEELITAVPNSDETITALWAELASSRVAIHRSLLVPILRMAAGRFGDGTALEDLLHDAATAIEKQPVAAAPVRVVTHKPSNTLAANAYGASPTWLEDDRQVTAADVGAGPVSPWVPLFGFVWPLTYITIGIVLTVLLFSFDRLG